MLIGDLHRRHGRLLRRAPVGRAPLAPRISPNKTVEGLIAGIVGGTFAFWFAGLYQDWLSGPRRAADRPLRRARGTGRRPVRVDAQARPGVKDTGRFFGAHGGVLDRLDAAFFTVVVGYYAANALGYG